MARKPVTVSLSAQVAAAGRPLSIEISSHAYTASAWTVRRRKTADGPADVRRLTWPEPVSSFHVWRYLMDRYEAGDPKWLPYRFLEAQPTGEGGRD